MLGAHVGTISCLSPEGAPGSGYQSMHIPATKVQGGLALDVGCKAVLVGLATALGLSRLVSCAGSCFEALEQAPLSCPGEAGTGG